MSTYNGLYNDFCASVARLKNDMFARGDRYVDVSVRDVMRATNNSAEGYGDAHAALCDAMNKGDKIMLAFDEENFNDEDVAAFTVRFHTNA